MTVIYNYCPDRANENSHMAPFYKCIERGEKIFDCIEKAIVFWLECSSPITKLEDLMDVSDSKLKEMGVEPISLKDIIVTE